MSGKHVVSVKSGKQISILDDLAPWKRDMRDASPMQTKEMNTTSSRVIGSFGLDQTAPETLQGRPALSKLHLAPEVAPAPLALLLAWHLF